MRAIAWLQQMEVVCGLRRCQNHPHSAFLADPKSVPCGFVTARFRLVHLLGKPPPPKLSRSEHEKVRQEKEAFIASVQKKTADALAFSRKVG
jgi:hypothetical protein